jgi:outer membrane protein OmpA-like peptidoglycan-associated protein
MIYFTRARQLIASDVGTEIFSSNRAGGAWSAPQRIKIFKDSTISIAHPAISPDGQTLYFASNRPNGKGGMDIWKSMLDADGRWSIPINLGDSINTKYDDVSPFIHPDNQTLYFASDGRMGMGGKDIFYSRKNVRGDWGRPVNIGYPINTYADEINLVVNAKGDLAFFSSNKPGGYGGLDLYTFDLYADARPMAVNYMKGKVFNNETQKPLEASFDLIEIESGKIVFHSKSDSYNGEFLICLLTGKEYALNVSKDGYLFYSDHFSINSVHTSMQPFLKDIPLKPIQIGESVVLKNIFFETDKFELKSESKIELGKLLALLKQNPRMKIEISGHTDNVGNEKYNLTLSENRARSVFDYLKANGVVATRLTYKGYGWSKPIESNDTETGRANNRRTEFKVMGN